MSLYISLSTTAEPAELDEIMGGVHALIVDLASKGYDVNFSVHAMQDDDEEGESAAPEQPATEQSTSQVETVPAPPQPAAVAPDVDPGELAKVAPSAVAGDSGHFQPHNSTADQLFDQNVVDAPPVAEPTS